MRPSHPPAAHFPVDRCGPWRLALHVVWPALGLAVLCGWVAAWLALWWGIEAWAAPHWPLTAAAVGGACLGLSLGAWLGWAAQRRDQAARVGASLAWDGQQWRWRCAQQDQTVTLQIVADAGHALVLRLGCVQPPMAAAGPAVAAAPLPSLLMLTRSDAPAAWHGLRLALCASASSRTPMATLWRAAP